LLRTASGLERDNPADGDGPVSLSAFRTRAVGGDNVDNELVLLVLEIANLRRQTLTVVKGKDSDRADVGFIQPLREFGIRHFA